MPVVFGFGVFGILFEALPTVPECVEVVSSLILGYLTLGERRWSGSRRGLCRRRRRGRRGKFQQQEAPKRTYDKSNIAQREANSLPPAQRVGSMPQVAVGASGHELH